MTGDILIELFPDHKFIKNYRPEWLMNKGTGLSLELDFYNEELKLAFEFQGGQHSKQISIFHGFGEEKEKNFNDQVKRDQEKKELCQERKILMIEIFPKDDIRKKISEVKEKILNNYEIDKNKISNFTLFINDFIDESKILGITEHRAFDIHKKYHYYCRCNDEEFISNDDFAKELRKKFSRRKDLDGILYYIIK